MCTILPGAFSQPHDVQPVPASNAPSSSTLRWHTPDEAFAGQRIVAWYRSTPVFLRNSMRRSFYLHQEWLQDHDRLPSLQQPASASLSDRHLNSWSVFGSEGHSPYVPLSPIQRWLSHVAKGSSANVRLLQNVVRESIRRKKAYRALRQRREDRTALQQLEASYRTFLNTSYWSESTVMVTRDLFTRATLTWNALRAEERDARGRATERQELIDVEHQCRSVLQHSCSQEQPHYTYLIALLLYSEAQRRRSLCLQERWGAHRLEGARLVLEGRQSMQQVASDSEVAVVELQEARYFFLSQDPKWVVHERCKRLNRECDEILQQLKDEEAHVHRQIMTAFSLQAFRKQFHKSGLQLDEALARGPRLRSKCYWSPRC